MTALQQLWIASVLGAVVFFAGGVLAAMIRLRGRAAAREDQGSAAPDDPRAAVTVEQIATAESATVEQAAQLRTDTEAPHGDAEIVLPSEPAVAEGSTTDALARSIERFSVPGVRCAAIVDEVGFLVASHGDGGVEIAGYAALLNDAANRAAEFLPVAEPTSIELVDAHGARISMWPFRAADTRLLLINLGTGATETRRVESVLSEVVRILNPPR